MSKRIIEVVNYRQEWPTEFIEERSKIESVLTVSNIVDIQHIGSTSVNGLCAKPIIDILLIVNSLDVLDKDTDEIATIGYLAKGEFGIPGRRYFQKGGAQRSHQMHAFLADSEGSHRHLAFRDYLRAFPDIAEQYGKVKQEGARLCNNDNDFYCEYKDSFVKEHEAKALEWVKSYK
ncbi:hypothetical protein CS022_05935 [Veronia nyctiphanis]|uniref:GrpB family protein n=1 Tax=Veronia nyctiphanis TaxID=1278244 RepID=A0A4Q0YSL7_9GAMM|nr:GrpB family protein [Veronia nyctiphanis]RXJ74156.1 hypothetical protein CS022_05935 [Veronia nyctiphanis]